MDGAAARRFRARFLALWALGVGVVVCAGWPLTNALVAATGAVQLVALLGLAVLAALFGPPLWFRDRLVGAERATAAAARVEAAVAADPLVARIAAADPSAGAVAAAAAARARRLRDELAAIDGAGPAPALVAARAALAADADRLEAELARLYAAVVQGDRAASADLVARLGAEAELAGPGGA
jgi:hypothetical protein